MKYIILPLLAAASCLQAAEKNVILIVTDDESKTLGCYGDPIAVTPAIDALAEESTIFNNAFATTASCSASRSVILTGTYNHANGQFGHAHHYHKFVTFYDLVSLSLPNAMSRSGYRTARIGKYHVAPEEVYRFDQVLPMKGVYGRNNVEMAKTCEAFIKEKSDKPFFLYFATNDPHRSRGIDQSSDDELKANMFGNLQNKEHYEGVEEVFYDPETVPVPEFLPDTNESRKELAQYYQSVSRIDQGVGLLIQYLKEADLYDKTMIIFTADHGMAFPGAKTTVYEGGMQVPFIVYNPYVTREKVFSDAMINHADIAPTILDFAGALDKENNRPKAWIDPADYWKGKPHAMSANRNGGIKFDHYHGASWLHALGKEHAEGEDETYASHTFHEITMYYPMRVVRDAEYKLIWNVAHDQPYPFASDLWVASTWQAQLAKGAEAKYGPWTVDGYQYRPEFELFDIQVDPWESNNLADDPKYAEILKKYQKKIKDFQKETDDPWLLKWDYE